MPYADDPRDEILTRLAEIRAVIKKTDDTLRTARDLEKHLEVVLEEVGTRLHSARTAIDPGGGKPGLS